MMHATVPSGGFWEKGHFSGNNLWSSGEKMAPFDQPVRKITSFLSSVRVDAFVFLLRYGR